MIDKKFINNNIANNQRITKNLQKKLKNLLKIICKYKK